MTVEPDLTPPLPLSQEDRQREAKDRRFKRAVRAERAYLRALADTRKASADESPSVRDERFVAGWSR